MSSTIYKSQLFGEVEVLLVKGPLFMEITIFVAMENGPLSSLIYLLTMVMFHRYVNVEGNSTLNHQMFLVQCPQKKKKRYARQATVPGTQGSRKRVELDDRASSTSLFGNPGTQGEPV